VPVYGPLAGPDAWYVNVHVEVGSQLADVTTSELVPGGVKRPPSRVSPVRVGGGTCADAVPTGNPSATTARHTDNNIHVVRVRPIRMRLLGLIRT